MRAKVNSREQVTRDFYHQYRLKIYKLRDELKIRNNYNSIVVWIFDSEKRGPQIVKNP